MNGKRLPSTAEGVMTTPVISTRADRSVREAAELMSSRNVGSIVVIHEEEPVGIVTERDLVGRVLAKGLDASKVLVKEIMSKPLITITSDLSLLDAIRLMQRKKVRRLLVKESERLVGIVTQRDLLRALAFHVAISLRPLLEAE